MPGQVMDPAFLSKLCHDGINPGKARLGFGPLGQRLHVSVPRDADTDGIALHLVEAWVVGRCCVEELSPQQLAIERERRGAVLLHLAKTQRSYSTGLALALATTTPPPSNTRLRSGDHLLGAFLGRLTVTQQRQQQQQSSSTHLTVEIGELEVKKTTRQATEAKVWTQACWTRQQGVGVHPGTLEVGYPGLQKRGGGERNKVS